MKTTEPNTLQTLPLAITASFEKGDANIIDFVASTAALDRYQEVIEPEGWQLDRYRQNPVFLNSHRSGDIGQVLGRALITEVREINGRKALFQRIEFAVDENPLAALAFGLYRGGFLKAVSVGFIPIRWVNGKDGDPFRRRYLEQELVELSAVTVPANAEALVLNALRGAGLQPSNSGRARMAVRKDPSAPSCEQCSPHEALTPHPARSPSAPYQPVIPSLVPDPTASNPSHHIFWSWHANSTPPWPAANHKKNRARVKPI
jgi:HK97 family phage prohead protease